jgi:hypothetical protein
LLGVVGKLVKYVVHLFHKKYNNENHSSFHKVLKQ